MKSRRKMASKKPITVPPNKVMPPTTTHEENLVTEGQRTINALWENTQAYIAKIVIITNLIVNTLTIGSVLAFRPDITANQLALISICLQPLSLTMSLVIGFYFGRTNHTKTGGTGSKIMDEKER